MAQRVRVLAVLPKEPDLSASTHTAFHNRVLLQFSSDLMLSSDFYSMDMVHTHTCRQDTHEVSQSNENTLSTFQQNFEEYSMAKEPGLSGSVPFISVVGFPNNMFKFYHAPGKMKVLGQIP